MDLLASLQEHPWVPKAMLLVILLGPLLLILRWRVLGAIMALPFVWLMVYLGCLVYVYVNPNLDAVLIGALGLRYGWLAAVLYVVPLLLVVSGFRGVWGLKKAVEDTKHIEKPKLKVTVKENATAEEIQGAVSQSLAESNLHDLKPKEIIHPLHAPLALCMGVVNVLLWCAALLLGITGLLLLFRFAMGWIGGLGLLGFVGAVLFCRRSSVFKKPIFTWKLPTVGMVVVAVFLFFALSYRVHLELPFWEISDWEKTVVDDELGTGAVNLNVVKKKVSKSIQTLRVEMPLPYNRARRNTSQEWRMVEYKEVEVPVVLELKRWIDLGYSEEGTVVSASPLPKENLDVELSFKLTLDFRLWFWTGLSF